LPCVFPGPFPPRRFPRLVVVLTERVFFFVLLFFAQMDVAVEELLAWHRRWAPAAGPHGRGGGLTLERWREALAGADGRRVLEACGVTVPEGGYDSDEAVPQREARDVPEEEVGELLDQIAAALEYNQVTPEQGWKELAPSQEDPERAEGAASISEAEALEKVPRLIPAADRVVIQAMHRRLAREGGAAGGAVSREAWCAAVRGGDGGRVLVQLGVHDDVGLQRKVSFSDSSQGGVGLSDEQEDDDRLAAVREVCTKLREVCEHNKLSARGGFDALADDGKLYVTKSKMVQQNKDLCLQLSGECIDQFFDYLCSLDEVSHEDDHDPRLDLAMWFVAFNYGMEGSTQARKSQLLQLQQGRTGITAHLTEYAARHKLTPDEVFDRLCNKVDAKELRHDALERAVPAGLCTELCHEFGEEALLVWHNAVGRELYVVTRERFQAEMTGTSGAEEMPPEAVAAEAADESGPPAISDRHTLIPSEEGDVSGGEPSDVSGGELPARHVQGGGPGEAQPGSRGSSAALCGDDAEEDPDASDIFSVRCASSSAPPCHPTARRRRRRRHLVPAAARTLHARDPSANLPQPPRAACRRP
jgi:hypothetical protein